MKLLDKKEVTKIAKKAARILDDKKLENIVLLDMGDEGVADYFIIATANSNTQASAAQVTLYKEFKKEKITPYAENKNAPDGLWTLIDYGFLVVHIFTPEGREYYELDKLWHEAKKVRI